MRNGRSLLVVALATAGLMATAGTAMAQTNYSWDGGAGAGDPNWGNALNWNPDGVPVNDPNGGTVNIAKSKIVDANGFLVNLPEMNITAQSGILDTAGTGVIIAATFKPHNTGMDFYPAIVANMLQASYRVGTVKYYDTVDSNTIDLSSGNHNFYYDTTADMEVKVWDGKDGDGIMRMSADGANPVPTLTTPKITVDGPPSLFSAEGLVDVDTVVVTNGGKYIAKGNNSIGDGDTSVTLTQGGYLELQVEQSALANVDVQDPYCVLAGHLGGATYGTGGNVSLVEDVILAPTGGTEPTRAELGDDAILYQGVTTSNKTLIVGDNEVDAIYKGAAIGAFYANSNISGISLTAEPGSGNLQVVFAATSCPDVTTNNKFYGDANRTADIQVLNGAYIRLNNSFNSDYDYVADADPTRIHTFNITGEVGKESRQILNHYRTSTTHIKEGQTWNISNGAWTMQSYFAGRGQHGDVTLTDGILWEPETAFSASDSGFTLTLGGTFAIRGLQQARLGNYEALDANFSYSGKPIIALQDNQNYDIDYDPNGANPIFADLLQNADISSTTYKEIDFAGDLQIGHEKYIFNAFERQDDHDGVRSTVGAEIIPAGNQPGGETAVIGLAATALGQGKNIDIDMAINAPGAIVRCGTTDPDRIVVANSGGFVAAIPTGTVILKKNVAAREIQIQSGSVTINSGVQLDSGAPATVFPISFDTVTAPGDLVLNGSQLDDLNPVTITANSGDRVQIGSNVDLSDTTIVANAGLTQVRIGGNNSTVTLGNLEMNTDVAFGSNNNTGLLNIVGTMSGTGKFITGNNKATVLSGGTLAPGNSVGELNKGGRIIRMADGAIYEWEIADPDANAGIGWDLIWGSDIDFDVNDADDANAAEDISSLTFRIVDAGLTRDITADEQFVVAAGGGFDVPAAWTVTFEAPVGWNASAAQLVDGGSVDVDGDESDERVYYLTGLLATRMLGTLTWDAGADGVWGEDVVGNWAPSGFLSPGSEPNYPDHPLVAAAVDTPWTVTVLDPNREAYRLAVSAGTVAVDAGGGLTVTTDTVIDGGTLDVAGRFATDVLTSSGTLTVAAGADVDANTLLVTDGAVSLSEDIRVGDLEITGGAVDTGDKAIVLSGTLQAPGVVVTSNAESFQAIGSGQPGEITVGMTENGKTTTVTPSAGPGETLNAPDLSFRSSPPEEGTAVLYFDAGDVLVGDLTVVDDASVQLTASGPAAPVSFRNLGGLGAVQCDAVVLSVRGAVRPGQGIGKLQVIGALAFEDGAAFQPEVQGADVSDVLYVETELDLTAGNDAIGPSWLPGSDASSMFGGEYVVANTGGIDGQFAVLGGGNIGAAYIADVAYDVDLGTGLGIAVTLHAQLAGDVDLDGQVARGDLLALRGGLGSTDADWLGGDLTFDGDVNYLDYIALKRSMGDSVPGGVGITPEPATLFVMMAAGLPALLKRRRA